MSDWRLAEVPQSKEVGLGQELVAITDGDGGEDPGLGGTEDDEGLDEGSKEDLWGLLWACSLWVCTSRVVILHQVGPHTRAWLLRATGTHLLLSIKSWK